MLNIYKTKHIYVKFRLFFKIMILKSNRKIQIILQHMFANPKPKTFMTYNIYLLIYVENNSVLVNLNLNY